MPKETRIVLYVEDEEMDRILMDRAFAKSGLKQTLRMVNDGQAAIDYLSGTGEYGNRETYPLPDVVLLDLNLPEVHGFDVLQWIRTQPEHRDLPVVIFSSSEMPEDQVRAQQFGANEFLKKPGSGLSFKDVVQKLHAQWLSAAAASSPLGASVQG